ncbi:MAG: CpsD/CapB family tyrosine-protein kinase [Ruminococcus sp.]|jgi:capsular exopolysaccharide synthesis family protein
MDRVTISENLALTYQEKEAFRTLRTNIEFTGVENRAIAVTSVAPSEGKSTVSYHLADAFAESGKKTLLVDADLRKSVLIHRLGIREAVKGLSYYLSGQEKMGDVIYSTNKKNLFLMPAGIFPVNPTELLGNSRFIQMIPVLKSTFDYVLIDTAPLSSVIDAAVVAKVCDGSVLVLAADGVSRTEAQNAVKQLKTANENLLGVVLNKVNFSKSNYYGKYGAYGKYGKYYGYEG